MEEVDFVEQEGMAVGYQVENLPWHIDRVDQRHLPLDYFYRPIGVCTCVCVLAVIL